MFQAGSFTRRLRKVAQVRLLHLHEYVALQTMQKFGLQVPKIAVASSANEARDLYKSVIGEGKDCMVKAQVLTGGRGMGTFKGGLKGGVQLCTKQADVLNFASKMIGDRLVTKQTTADGVPCNKVMLVERIYMRRELYVSILMDRASGGPVMVASPSGGMSIEDVAARTPELIFRHRIDIMKGLQQADASRLATSLGCDLGSIPHTNLTQVLMSLYQAFIKCDATMLEINPLAETPDGKVLVCDTKLNIDDNSDFRQSELFQLRDTSQEDPREVKAHTAGLNYISLSGNIGCMVNGAGLAMATMDMIALKGGQAANFLDVGGGASQDQVEAAFELLNNDANVKTILVNIFGGIMRCDVIAAGIIKSAKHLGVKKPLIIRLQGTNVDQAKQLIENSAFKMIMCDDLESAASKAVSIAEIMKQAEAVELSVKFEVPL